MTEIEIVQATADDLPAVRALFDDAVRWLVAQGSSGQSKEPSHGWALGYAVAQSRFS